MCHVGGRRARVVRPASESDASGSGGASTDDGGRLFGAGETSEVRAGEIGVDGVVSCVVGCGSDGSFDGAVWSSGRGAGIDGEADGVVRVDGVIGRSARSCAMVVLALGSWTGTYYRRNFLLRSVTLPEPSTLTTYWLNCRTSMMTPVLSHFLAYGPTWFCMRTWSPIFSGGKRLVCSDHFSTSRM